MSDTNIPGTIEIGPRISRAQLNRTIIEYLLLFAGFVLIAFLVPDDEATFGILSAIPAIFLLGFIFYTKRILEGLTLAALLGPAAAGCAPRRRR